MKELKTNSGIVLRRGRRWGPTAVAWAEMALAYASPLEPVLQTRRLELLLWGDFVKWEAPDGAQIWGGPSDEIGELALEDIYRNGDFVPDLAWTWPLHQFIRVGRDGQGIDVLLGRFYPRGSFYAAREGDVLIAPEYKAFSGVHALKSIRPFPRGHRLRLDEDGEAVRFEAACPPFKEPEVYPAYEEACRLCRQMMEDALDAALERLNEPYVLALSGGMDSSLLAYRLAARGVRPLAYNVWFDRGQGAPPRDVTVAREVARDLGLELREIRVTAETVRSIMAEAIALGEWAEDYQLYNALYHIPFLRELKRIGVRRRLTANGVDNAFAGYAHFKHTTSREDFRRLYFELLAGANTRHISTFNSFYGFKNSTPFRTTPLLHFGLSLPVEYLADREGEGYRGKRIVRDAYRGEVPDSILEQSKLLPGQVNDAAVMTQELLGGPENCQMTYSRIREVFLTIPDLRRTPLWFFRMGRGERLMKKRRREGKRVLESALRPKAGAAPIV